METFSQFNPTLLLVAIFTPLIVGLILLAGKTLPRSFSSGFAFLGFALPAAIAVWLFLPSSEAFGSPLKLRFTGPWGFSFGLNGISLPLFAMTAVVGLAAGIKALIQEVENRNAYLGLVLFMLGGTLGVFATDNIIGFYFFHEFALVPTFILTLYWGGEGRRSAAMQMAIYLTVGAMLSLAGILIAMSAAGLSLMDATFEQLFLGLHNPQVSLPTATAAITLFGFGTLASLFPFHSWAAPGYSAAPTPVSMIHAGALKKFGLYGIIIIAAASMNIGHGTVGKWFLICAVANVVIAGLICLAQRDLKQLISWSSVAHMGPIFLGIWVCTSRGVAAGLDAALFLMVAHGLSCAALFLLANAVRTRTGTYRFDELGGLAKHTPILAACFVAATMASVGLPGFGNFWGEIGVFLSLKGESLWLQALVASTVVISAVYSLRAVANVFFGPPSKEITERFSFAPFKDLSGAERLATFILLGASLAIGFAPHLITRHTNEDAQGLAKLSKLTQANSPHSTPSAR
jgi:NADH-quinone oxidoreductase subunit M